MTMVRFFKAAKHVAPVGDQHMPWIPPSASKSFEENSRPALTSKILRREGVVSAMQPFTPGLHVMADIFPPLSICKPVNSLPPAAAESRLLKSMFWDTPSAPRRQARTTSSPPAVNLRKRDVDCLAKCVHDRKTAQRTANDHRKDRRRGRPTAACVPERKPYCALHSVSPGPWTTAEQ